VEREVWGGTIRGRWQLIWPSRRGSVRMCNNINNVVGSLYNVGGGGPTKYRAGAGCHEFRLKNVAPLPTIFV
jgi:hypothetical protein